MERQNGTSVLPLSLIEYAEETLWSNYGKDCNYWIWSELAGRIYKYFDEVNEEPIVYHWTWNFDDIDPTESVTAYQKV